jgi:hypothetical protein
MQVASDFVRLHPLEAGEQAVSGFVSTPGRTDAVERSLLKQRPLDQLRLVQRMWVAGSQRVGIKATESLRGLIDGMEQAVGQLASDPVRLDTSKYFSPCIVFNDVTGLLVSERLTLVRQDTAERVTVDHEELDEGADPATWFNAKVERFLSRMSGDGAQVVSTDSGKLFGTLAATVVTVRTRQALAQVGHRNVLTKIGFACSGSDTYQLAISLGEDQQTRFPGLARHAHLLA